MQKVSHINPQWKAQNHGLIIYLDCAFFASRGYPLTVRTELETCDRFAMSFVGKDTTFSSYIPQLEVCITRSRAKKVSIRMKVDASNSSFMASQGPHQPRSFQVPDFQGTRGWSRTNEFFGMTKSNTFDRRGVSTQTLQKGKKWKPTRLLMTHSLSPNLTVNYTHDNIEWSLQNKSKRQEAKCKFLTFKITKKHGSWIFPTFRNWMAAPGNDQNSKGWTSVHVHRKLSLEFRWLVV